jgi:hypothetical protein
LGNSCDAAAALSSIERDDAVSELARAGGARSNLWALTPSARPVILVILVPARRRLQRTASSAIRARVHTSTTHMRSMGGASSTGALALSANEARIIDSDNRQHREKTTSAVGHATKSRN